MGGSLHKRDFQFSSHCYLLLLATLAVGSVGLVSIASSSEAPNTTTPLPLASKPTEAATSLSSSTATTITTTTQPTPTASAAKISSPTDNQPTTTANPLTSISQDNSSDYQELKRKIQQHIIPNHGEMRLALNKPTLAPPPADFAADSAESRVSDATTQFGLSFIRNLPNSGKENVVISPLSLQSLLNMVLLGTSDNSTTREELVKVLGYEHLVSQSASDQRLLPHEAMRTVLQSILAATHLSVGGHLFNTNDGELNKTAVGSPPSSTQSPRLEAHLQTSSQVGKIPLNGQLNFTLANLVLTNKDLIELKKEFENELKSYYDVRIEQFSQDRGNTSNKGNKSVEQLPVHERINKWVKKITQNQIEKLAEESDLSGDDLIMVLLNAAHFKGRWLHTFSQKATSDKSFFNNGNEAEPVKAKFMRQKSVFGYADFGTAAQQNELADSRSKASEDAETVLTEDAAAASADEKPTSSLPEQASPPVIELSNEEARRQELTSKLNCSALMLPFSLNEGQELSMVILLPTRRDGLAELQAALTGPALDEIYRSLSEQQVQVELPKFSFEGSYDAKATLTKMGLKSIFQDSAKLERMCNVIGKASNAGARVGKVIHKAKISVDESGAEAAAASMASIVLRNFIRPPMPVFIADHPFLFIIRHNRSNMPLFMGCVNRL